MKRQRRVSLLCCCLHLNSCTYSRFLLNIWECAWDFLDASLTLHRAVHHYYYAMLPISRLVPHHSPHCVCISHGWWWCAPSITRAFCSPCPRKQIEFRRRKVNSITRRASGSVYAAKYHLCAEMDRKKRRSAMRQLFSECILKCCDFVLVNALSQMGRWKWKKCNAVSILFVVLQDKFARIDITNLLWLKNYNNHLNLYLPSARKK